MAVITSLKRAPGLLREQPILFVPILVVSLLQVPQLFAQTLDPLVSAGVSLVFSALYVFVLPFVMGGLIGMANDVATAERTSIGRFFRYGKANYLSLLGAYLVIFGISFAFAIVSMLVVFVGVFGAIASGGETAAIVVAGLLYLAIFLVFLAVMAVLQFYGHAVVIDDARAIASLRRSVDVVRSNLRQVVGYFAIAFGGGLLAGGASVAIGFWLFTPAQPGEPAAVPDLGPAAVGIGGFTLLTTVLGGVFLVYSVLFYRSITGRDGTAPLGSSTRLGS